MTTPYLTGELLDLDRWAHDCADARDADRDPLPRGLRGAVPAVRRRSEPRGLRLRAAEVDDRWAAPARAAVAARAGHRPLSCASTLRAPWPFPRRRPRSPDATCAATSAAIGDRRSRAARSAAAHARPPHVPHVQDVQGARDRAARRHDRPRHRRARRDGKRPGARRIVAGARRRGRARGPARAAVRPERPLLERARRRAAAGDRHRRTPRT